MRQDFKVFFKNNLCVCVWIFNSIFSWHKYITWKISNGLCTVVIRHSTQKFDGMYLLDFYKRERYPLLHSHTLFTSLLSGSMYCCEQLFSGMKHRKNEISSKIADKHFETSWRIEITIIKPDQSASFTKTRSNMPLLL